MSGNIQGSVIDESGNNLANATIELTNTATKATKTLTAGDGFFQVEMPDGTYDVRASVSGYQSVTIPNIPADGGTEELTLTLPPAQQTAPGSVNEGGVIITPPRPGRHP
jgi:hypothetical protein